MAANIFVLAGVNGAGKSSIGGAALAAMNRTYFNPDLAARVLTETNNGLALEQANGYAWEIGRQGLERALREKGAFAFETTLGANTIPDMLLAGALGGAQIHVWYAGLSSHELHIQRVRERVKSGGHDIPEDKIRARYESSRGNLIRLLPYLASLRLYDNSIEGDPKAGRPQPVLLMHYENRCIISHVALSLVPQWAKPVLAGALEVAGKHERGV